MTSHLYFGLGIGLCGQHIDADNTINEENDGTTFGPGEQCSKCAAAFVPTARWILDKMLGRFDV